MDKFNKRITEILEANDFPSKGVGTTPQQDKQTKKIIGDEDSECCQSPVKLKSIVRKKKTRRKR